MRVSVPYPPKALSPNASVHHMALYRAKRAYKDAVCTLCLAHGANRLTGPFLVHVTFHPINRGPVPDKDNLIAAFKAGQDGLAQALGVDDREFNDRLTHSIGDRSPQGEVVIDVVCETEGLSIPRTAK